MSKSFTITKKIAKHGNQAIIVVPKILEKQLKPGTLTQVTIEILK
ncbi:MAG: hypothetical protein PHH54_05355 [Candidatus Nanoarchaeia archaeon]|nr:hypothetical protein [Candidatus Nanoarchaeia archaeon]MDD5741385.1 hypothetical protein [Candidatus Nanoarchaeia archaeon]